jgi:hypothetical protein
MICMSFLLVQELAASLAVNQQGFSIVLVPMFVSAELRLT